MKPKDNVILTEDGQRLTVEDGTITGTDDSGPGLGHETGTTTLNDPAYNPTPKERCTEKDVTEKKPDQEKGK